MKTANYTVVVERVFSDKGESLENMYIEYMASKIAEVIKDICTNSSKKNVIVS